MPEQTAFTVRESESLTKDASTKPARRGSVSDAVKRRKYVRRPKRDMHAPKRPLSAYINFSKDQRNEYEQHNWSFSTLAKQIGEDWRDLDIQKKNRYLEEAAVEKYGYDQAMRQYKSTAAYSNYRRYVQEFSRRHNVSRAADQSSSPEQSPSPSFQGDDSPDEHLSMREYYELDSPHAQAVSKGSAEQHHHHNGVAGTNPPGTVNPASLDGGTPSPTGMDLSAGINPEHHASEFINSTTYPLDPFGSSGLNMSVARPTNSLNTHPRYLGSSVLYTQGNSTMHSASMTAFHRNSTADEPMSYQQSGYEWTNAYVGTA